MAVPKRRTSRSRKGMRRSHHKLEVRARIRCAQCNAAMVPHRVCANCGFYRGRNVLFLDAEA